MNSKGTSKWVFWGLAVAVTLALAAGVIVTFQQHQPVHTGRHNENQAARKNIPAAANTNFSTASASSRVVAAALELSRREKLFADFQKRPFAVVRESKDYGWTDEDGKNPDAVRKLAHNELEFERMAEENNRIYRRQLVYVRQPVDGLVQDSKLSGDPIRHLTLPGLDGQELEFDITRTDLSASGQSGTFSGHLAGRPNSMVTLAFKGGREAFTILSSVDNLYLVGEPREPNQIIVKSINPATYVPGVCGNP